VGLNQPYTLINALHLEGQLQLAVNNKDISKVLQYAAAIDSVVTTDDQEQEQTLDFEAYVNALKDGGP